MVYPILLLLGAVLQDLSFIPCLQFTLFGRSNIQISVTNMTKQACSKDICRGIRNVKSLIKVFYNMRCFVMFVTAVCVLFLLKLKWPKNKSFYVSLSLVLASVENYLNDLTFLSADSYH